jgi:toxin CcdB
MRQFDVYANPNVPQRAAFPYLVVLQSEHLDDYSTRLVMPLATQPPSGSLPNRLSQRVEIDGDMYTPAAHLCAALPISVLKNAKASLHLQQDILRDALDVVLSGV